MKQHNRQMCIICLFIFANATPGPFFKKYKDEIEKNKKQIQKTQTSEQLSLKTESVANVHVITSEVFAKITFNLQFLLSCS